MKLENKMVVVLANELQTADGEVLIPKGTIAKIEIDPSVFVRVSSGSKSLTACFEEVVGSTIEKLTPVTVLAGKIGEGEPIEFQSIEEAANWIDAQREHDNEGVERGDYYIDDMSDSEYSTNLQTGKDIRREL
jgi:hypothetical protein